MQQSHIVAPLNGARLGKDSGTVTGPAPFPPVTRSLRAEPSPIKGRNSFRAWTGETPPLDLLADTPGSALGPQDLRKLGGPATRVWRYLMELRGYAVRPVRVALKRLAKELGIAERTLDRAMLRLRVSGLVDGDRNRVLADQWVSMLTLTVWGAREIVRGVERLWAPDHTITWCDQARAQGRPRAENLAPQSRSREPLNADLGHKPGALITYKRVESSPCVSQHKDTPPGGAALLCMKRQKPFYVQKPKSTVTLPALLDGDPDDPVTQNIWVRHLAQAYNLAAQEVFQRPGRCYPPESKKAVQFSTWDPATGTTAAKRDPETQKDPLRNWRYFEPLLAAARALHEHRVSPLAWATWTMRLSHAAQLRETKKPAARAVNAVFVAAHVHDSKRRGFFHRTTEHRGGRQLEVTRVHEEQHYRKQEVSRRARGIEHLFGLPDWYAKLREEEIAQGVTDPLERFPWTMEETR